MALVRVAVAVSPCSRSRPERSTRAGGGASAVVLLAAALACGGGGGDSGDEPSDLLAELLPAGFPAPRVPEDNPLTAEKVALGRHLFYDERLSGNATQSCASCHRQELAFTDGKVAPSGSTGEALVRNSPTLTNAAYNATLTWANPSLTEFEEQLLVPIFGEAPVELGATGREDQILQRFAADGYYAEQFPRAFPELAEPISFPAVVRALASFVRTMISGRSPYDRFVYEEEEAALSPSARRGLELFFSERLECFHCHSGFNLTQSTLHAQSAFGAARFHNTGLYNVDGRGAYPARDTGLYEFTSRFQDMGRFRAPTLRNIGVTAPYMHDGSLETLEDVLRFYGEGGRNVEEGPDAGDGRRSPLKSGFMVGFELTEAERDDVVAFLESLTDRDFLTAERWSNPWPERQP